LVRRHRAEAAALRAAEIDVPCIAALETAARRAASLLVHAPVGAELVVLFSFLRIAEHLVRLVDLLEFPLGGLVPWLDVGVVLARELPKRLLDLFRGGGLGHAQRRVVVFEVHPSYQRPPFWVLRSPFSVNGDPRTENPEPIYSKPSILVSSSSSCANRRF